MRLRLLFISFFLLSGHLLTAAHDKVLYAFERADLDAMNVRTLADLIRFLPLHTSHHQGAALKVHVGADEMRLLTIFKDGIPLFMDNVIASSYFAISLHDIEEVKLVQASLNSQSKGIGLVNLFLVSKAIDDRASGLELQMAVNTLRDFSSQGRASLSNRKHSFGIDFQRCFENAIQAPNHIRKHDIPSFIQNQVGLGYRWNILAGSYLKLNFQTNQVQSFGRGAIIPNTSRAEDVFFNENSTRLSSVLDLKLSRTHRLDIQSIYNRYHRYAFIKEVDLNSGKFEVLPVGSATDSLLMDYFHSKATISRRDTSKPYWYTLGLEVSSLNDRNYSTVNAIEVAYVDYTLSGQFNYHLGPMKVGAGLHVLNNTVMGVYLLPRLSADLEASRNIDVDLNYVRSLIYPMIPQLFYSAQMRMSDIENTIGLKAGTHDIFSAAIKLKNSWGNLESGVSYARLANGVDASEAAYNNSYSSRTAVNYIAVNLDQGLMRMRLFAALNGANAYRQEIDQLYYTPEVNVLGALHWEEAQWHLTCVWKLYGEHRQLVRSAKGFDELRHEGFNFLNVGMSKSFMSRRLKLAAGIENVLDQLAGQRYRYNIDSSIPDLESVGSIFGGRGRAYYFTLSMNLG